MTARITATVHTEGYSDTSTSYLISTQAQYVFVHDALDELISCGETDIHVLNLKVKLGSMHKIIPSRGITGFHDQYQVRKCQYLH